MWNVFFLCLVCVLAGCSATSANHSVTTHPDTTGWAPLFAEDLSNADAPNGVWTVADGVMTASKDQNIWTQRDYDNFILDLEFKTGPNANSGVIVYSVDTKNWIPGAIEVQILDDQGDKWTNIKGHGRCGAIYGHVTPSKRVTKPAGQWNRMTITCIDTQIDVVLNGEHITAMDMTQFTDNKTNPDGTTIPRWLKKPVATLPTHGKIGLQGKHGGAPIWFRNLRIKELDN